MPAYSPDLDPIEEAFSEFEAHPRRAQARARRHLDAAIVEAVDSITAFDACGWFARAGYRTGYQPT
ncbi:hypothetical protein [Kineococcus sp. SYSU DK005]|uniref:hypothetical protein n=1 Tax=Kineococcus sp. SYSU DK005 TaxID=3383126 RepID=UPI003D7CDEA7